MSFIMKKRFTLSFLLLTFVAQAQVIPVGFIKTKAFVATAIVSTNLIINLDAANTSSYNSGISTTTWSDLSGNGNNGTLVNGPTYSSANGGSIVFDGTNDYVDVASNASLTPTSMTLFCFLYPKNFNLAKIIEILSMGCIGFFEYSPLLEKELGLIAMKHYVPCTNKEDGKLITDVEYYKYYLENKEGKGKIIAENGREYVRKNFSNQNGFENYVRILNNI